MREPVHPFLFSFYPILSVYSSNIGELLPADLLVPVVTVLCFTGVLLGLAMFWFRDRKAAGLGVSMLLVPLLLYRVIVSPIATFFGGSLVELALIPVMIALVVSGWRGADGFAADDGSATRTLNIVATVILVIPLVTVVSYDVVGQQDSPVMSSGQLAGDSSRDIFYIVPDRYNGQESLQEFYGYNNSGFVDALERRGFAVADGARANYPRTWLSLASSLNMRYLHDGSFEPGERVQRNRVLRMIRDFDVQRLLQDAGYTYVHSGTWYQHTSTNPHADITINTRLPSLLGRLPLDQFHNVLFEQSVVYPVYAVFSGEGSLVGDEGIPARAYRDAYLEQADRLVEVAGADRKQFVFAHFALPHYPYVMDGDGSVVDHETRSSRSYEENYIAQLRGTNRLLIDMIDRIRDNYPQKEQPIIIVQSDEGSFPGLNDQKTTFSIDPGTTRELDQKTSILSAVYLPGSGASEVSAPRTPVNTFRIVFNRYFGTEIPLLRDRVFTYTDDGSRVKLYELTSDLFQNRMGR